MDPALHSLSRGLGSFPRAKLEQAMEPGSVYTQITVGHTCNLKVEGSWSQVNKDKNEKLYLKKKLKQKGLGMWLER
jgi:hypothetical protein